MKPSSRFVEAIGVAATLFVCWSGIALAQDVSEHPPSSLGDVARKSRQRASDKDHITAKKVLNEDGTSKPTLTVITCQGQPCFRLRVTLPAPVAWNYATGYTPVPLPGHENDNARAIRIYEADSWKIFNIEEAKRAFLQQRFAYWYGQPAKFIFDEATTINGYHARITHFTVTSRITKFRGLALTASVPTGSFGFACVFRDQDSGDATSICEGILGSASMEVPGEYRSQVVPDDPPEEPAMDDPSGDPPEAL